MLELMLQGALVSLKVFTLTIIFAVPLALPIALGKTSKHLILRSAVNLYLLVMRGTPLILQLIFIYFAPKYLYAFLYSNFSHILTPDSFWAAAKFILSYDRFTAVIIAFTLNYAAYFAEIYRGGIQSIPKGQFEAAKALGFTKTRTYTSIILPQVVKRVIPAMGNEVITLVKDTALAQVIGVAELFHAAQNAASREFSTMPIFIAGIFYFVMNYLTAFAFAAAEKKLSYYS
ncbi:MAG: amino acid ABC transporter permease [Spirochaetaceae bacterium]|jgi:polar amino acid transport system permease protein|nr:amino acid ABC transporter permease [Spirochaetaceae bacterium]